MQVGVFLLTQLFAQCAPSVAPETLMPLVSVESAQEPFAVANITDNTSHYFDKQSDAVKFLNTLTRQGKNFSAGLMQINAKNFSGLGLTNETVFDYCTNIKAGSKILENCYLKTTKKEKNEQVAIRNALSCYYSGNEKRGYKKESNGTSYIERIEMKSIRGKLPVVPALITGNQSTGKNIQNKSFLIMDAENEGWDIFKDYLKSDSQ
ncbi:lytic transglycosylase domain-containing protein [Arsenophonus nasoniae]|uniref:lytic transglycosylase domain-containing protein n=1 Tax=Arsenophonus nasoniae TaxID=638 RepID=UPI00387A7022